MIPQKDAQVIQAVGTDGPVNDHGQSPNVWDDSTSSKKVPSVECSQVPNEKSEVLVGSTNVAANVVEASDVGNAPTLASPAANRLEGKAFILFTTAFMLTMLLMSLDTTIICKLHINNRASTDEIPQLISLFASNCCSKNQY
jgi:hypothetical protein